MERMAAPLGDNPYDPWPDLRELQAREEALWGERLEGLDGPLNAGEGQFYHETRRPFAQTADYAALNLAATSISIIPISTVLIGSSLQFNPGYWDLGKKVHLRVFGKLTTAATPGNLTVELRLQNGTPTDAGGTILATSVATALVASKTAASFFADFTVEARAAIGTAANLFGKGLLWVDPTFGVIAAANTPIFVPSNAAANASFDTTQSSTLTVQMKRSGSTVETVAVHDFQVNALT